MVAADTDFSNARIDLLRQAVAKRPDSRALVEQLADALWQAGRPGEFSESSWRAALLLQGAAAPLSGVEPDRKAADLRDSSRALIEQGFGFSSVISDLAIAETQLGNDDAARRLMDVDRFVRSTATEPPDGRSAEEFHRVLAAEVKANLHFHDAPTDRAIRHGWQFNGVTRSKTPSMTTLQRLFRTHIDRYIAELPDDPSHPFIKARPADYTIDGWAIVSDGATHHVAHIHPQAWLTGIYYVVEADVSRAPGGTKGWLRVGPPLDEATVRHASWGSRLIEPAPGTLVLMPGYFYHGTVPLGVDQERICIPFNVNAKARDRSGAGDAY